MYVCMIFWIFYYFILTVIACFQVALSEDDLTVLMKILLENLGEASPQPSPALSAQEAVRVRKDIPSGPDYLRGRNR